MKRVLYLIMFVFTMASCSKSEIAPKQEQEQNQWKGFSAYLSKHFAIVIRDDKGNNLLAKNTAQGYTDDDIVVGQYDKKGNFIEGAAYSKAYIVYGFKENYIDITPVGPFFGDLPHNDEKIYTTILKIGKNNPADTFTCRFKTSVPSFSAANKATYGGSFIILDKVWLNGKLVWDSTVNEYPYFVVVKKHRKG